MFTEAYKLRSASSYSFLQFPTSKYFPSSLFGNITNLCSSFTVTDEFSVPHKTASLITRRVYCWRESVLEICRFEFGHGKR